MSVNTLTPQLNEISLIVAIDKKTNGIGYKNELLYHIKEDMEHFKEVTMGKVVVMGRKTYESLPLKFKPLPNRVNIVISNNVNLTIKGVEVFNDVQKVLEWCLDKKYKDILFIGGAQVYEYVINNNIIDTMYITEVWNSGEVKKVDTYFPYINFNKDWIYSEMKKGSVKINEEIGINFCKYKKILQ